MLFFIILKKSKMLKNEKAAQVRAAKAEQILSGVPLNTPVDVVINESYIDTTILPKVPSNLKKQKSRTTWESYVLSAKEECSVHPSRETIQLFTTKSPKKDWASHLHNFLNLFRTVINSLEEKTGCILKPHLAGDSWYFYNGLHWELNVGANEFNNFYVSICETALLENGLYLKPSVVNEVVAMLKRELSFKNSDFKQPKDRPIIPFLNGVLEFDFRNIETHTGVFREHKAADNLLYCLEFTYDPTITKMPIFEKYFAEVLPCFETRLSLLEYVGSCFIKMGVGYKFEKLAVLLGNQKDKSLNGANGKSAFTDILKGILGGQNISEESINHITDDNEIGQKTRFKVDGKLINCSGEMPKTFEDFKGIKLYTSNELKSTKQLFKDLKTADQLPKLMINANTMPKGEDVFGFARRFLIYPFNVNIDKKRIDKELDLKIVRNEAAPLLNAFICGLYRVIKNKNISETEVMENAVNTWKAEFNPVACFIAESCTITTVESDRLTSKAVWGAFQLFVANEPQFKRVGKNEFIKEFKAKFEHKTPNNSIEFVGIKLNDNNSLF